MYTQICPLLDRYIDKDSLLLSEERALLSRDLVLEMLCSTFSNAFLKPAPLLEPCTCRGFCLFSVDHMIVHSAENSINIDCHFSRKLCSYFSYIFYFSKWFNSNIFYSVSWSRVTNGCGGWFRYISWYPQFESLRHSHFTIKYSGNIQLSREGCGLNLICIYMTCVHIVSTIL